MSNDFRKKYSCKHIGLKVITRQGYDIEVIDGSYRKGYCVIRISGHYAEAQVSHVTRGDIKNKMHPSVLGVGYFGYGVFEATNKGKITPAYNTWSSMIKRCYCEKYHKTRPTYIGCTVHPDWHNFQVFAAWYHDHYIDGYQLDKDINIKGNKVYSPETCLFVSPAANTIEAKAKSYRFLNPRGEIVEVHNLSAFCRKNKLTDSNMCKVHSGKAMHHKQWKKA